MFTGDLSGKNWVVVLSENLRIQKPHENKEIIASVYRENELIRHTKVDYKEFWLSIGNVKVHACLLLLFQ